MVDSQRALRDVASVGRRVVVDGGEPIGVQTALFLAAQGREVTLVAHGQGDLFADDADEFATDLVGRIVRPLLLERLQASVRMLAKRGIKRITPEGAVVDLAGAFPPPPRALRFGPIDEDLVPADTVVLGVRRRPADDLYDELVERRDDLHIVVDAIEPRSVEEAIAEGSAAARSIGTDLSVTPVGQAEPVSGAEVATR